MASTKPIQKNRSSEFTATYLRLLTGGQPARADWAAAAELIDSKMATGTAHRSSTTADGEIDALHGFAPTLQGRIYADQLQELAKARSLLGRLRKWVWLLGGAIGGILAESATGLLLEAAKRALGW